MARSESGPGTAPHDGQALPFFIARQPIYDRYRQVHAYEMLFRGLEDTGEARFLDGTTATAQLITQGVAAWRLRRALGRSVGIRELHARSPGGGHSDAVQPGAGCR